MRNAESSMSRSDGKMPAFPIAKPIVSIPLHRQLLSRFTMASPFVWSVSSSSSSPGFSSAFFSGPSKSSARLNVLFASLPNSTVRRGAQSRSEDATITIIGVGWSAVAHWIGAAALPCR